MSLSWWHTSRRSCRCFPGRRGCRARNGPPWDAYAAKGWGAGMAGFIAMTSWRGEFTDEYLARTTPDPAQFGMPARDDGSRDDPLLSDHSSAVTSYRPDFDALSATPTRIVVAVGEESAGTFTGRTSVATAELLGQRATVFPSHHGGFVGRRPRLRRSARSLRPQAARRPRRGRPDTAVEGDSGRRDSNSRHPAWKASALTS